ncbi:hypothetical protein [Saccharibacillus sp. JS10]|uniref:hypothetical protein n=1 Tax=Saccharibacillus sp. JS10 TaxID=2950552 RepID=UPI00210A9C4E|nr:hypothetical protein [Saccharibacillus sp. JS10]MCQ4088206.1 hypothetical protein [Saccharibacillus sp. JS10]
MTMSVHNLMAFHSQFNRPQPITAPPKNNIPNEEKSFEDILREKMASSKVTV